MALKDVESNHWPKRSNKVDVPLSQDLVLITNSGIQRMEDVYAQLQGARKFALCAAVFILSFVYFLDGTIRYTYQVKFPASFDIIFSITSIGNSYRLICRT
jgi:multisubunit Na+/H+ antiporter MnhG subunit